MKDLKSSVYKETTRILRILDSTRNDSRTRALLANIRNSINKDNSKNIDALAFIFQNLSKEVIGSSKELNDYEKAILTAVQMYALHQQSNAESILKLDYEDGEMRQNLGDALSSLRTEESKSIDVRFNTLVTARNFTQLQNHLRQMIKILKTKSDAKVDYASLAEDLYWFLRNQKDDIKIKWARSYYKFRQEDSKGEN